MPSLRSSSLLLLLPATCRAPPPSPSLSDLPPGLDPGWTALSSPYAASRNSMCSVDVKLEPCVGGTCLGDDGFFLFNDTMPCFSTTVKSILSERSRDPHSKICDGDYNGEPIRCICQGTCTRVTHSRCATDVCENGQRKMVKCADTTIYDDAFYENENGQVRTFVYEDALTCVDIVCGLTRDEYALALEQAIDALEGPRTRHQPAVELMKEHRICPTRLDLKESYAMHALFAALSPDTKYGAGSSCTDSGFGYGARWHCNWRGVTCFQWKVTDIYLPYREGEGCRFQGSVPEQVRLLSSLETLVLSDHEIRGTVPSGIATLGRLAQLELDRNRLIGFSEDLYDMSGLKSLSLHTNCLQQRLDGDVKGLQDLQILRLHNNDLSGKLPTALQDLRQLRRLNLHCNRQLIGTCSQALCRNTDFLLKNFTVSCKKIQHCRPRCAQCVEMTPIDAATGIYSCGGYNLTDYCEPLPSAQPSFQPSDQPTEMPSDQPSFQPSFQPSDQPSTKKPVVGDA
mmetsp:Transcript_28111/g.64330  ORF Transcript_28111/g.64330 Transcript_28111/m.64330 type:complete len:512 (-) Transcript_28111:645-2180(-)